MNRNYISKIIISIMLGLIYLPVINLISCLGQVLILYVSNFALNKNHLITNIVFFASIMLGSFLVSLLLYRLFQANLFLSSIFLLVYLYIILRANDPAVIFCVLIGVCISIFAGWLASVKINREMVYNTFCSVLEQLPVTCFIVAVFTFVNISLIFCGIILTSPIFLGSLRDLLIICIATFISSFITVFIIEQRYSVIKLLFAGMMSLVILSYFFRYSNIYITLTFLATVCLSIFLIEKLRVRTKIFDKKIFVLKKMSYKKKASIIKDRRFLNFMSNSITTVVLMALIPTDNIYSSSLLCATAFFFATWIIWKKIKEYKVSALILLGLFGYIGFWFSSIRHNIDFLFLTIIILFSVIIGIFSSWFTIKYVVDYSVKCTEEDA